MRSIRRSSVGIVAVAMALALVVAAPVSAKPKESSRSVFFGSSENGTLDVSPDPVFTGGYVSFTAVASNGGNQNLTHATFGLGTLAAVNPTTALASLPAGWTIFSITPSAGACTLDGPAGSAVGAMCDLGTLVGKTGVLSVAVVLNAATASSDGVWASFKVAEQVNDNGANRDTWFATSGVSAGAACDTPAASKLPGNVRVHLEYNTSSCTTTQSSTADLVTGAFSSGELKQQSSGPNCRPGQGAECFGDYTLVDVQVVPGGAVVEWTVTWDVSALSKNFKISRLGVIHFPDQGPAVKIDATDLCADSSDIDCTIASGYINGDTQVFMTFRTPENGSARGYG